MTLKEKFSEPNLTADECVDIADIYAEKFGKWLRENDDKSLFMSELLEKFNYEIYNYK
jgi:hypothetical protein